MASPPRATAPAQHKPGYYTGLAHDDPALLPALPTARNPAGEAHSAPPTAAGLATAGAPGPPGSQIAFADYLRLHRAVADKDAKYHPPEWRRQAALQAERKRLHEQSVAMVAKWNNTIAGQRKARLAAQHEKARAAEEQRQQIDQDWAVVKAAERQAMVERAKKMQYLQDVRVRQLNSQALITQVLKERQAQIDYKKAEHDLAAQRALDTLLSDLARLATADAAAAARAQQVKAMQVAIAQTNRNMSESHRTAHAQERADLRDWCAEQASAALAEDRADKARATRRKAQQTKELVEVLDWCVKDKHARDAHVKDEAAELDRIHGHILRIKERIALQRRATEAAMIRARIERNEAVAAQQVPQLVAFHAARTEFLQKIEHAHDGDGDRRARAEAEQRARNTAATVEALQLGIEERRQQQVLARLEAADGRKASEAVARAAAHSAERRKERVKRIQAVYGDLYRKEIDDHSRAERAERAAHHREHQDAADRKLREDRDLHQFASHLCRDLRVLGNDPAPVAKKLAEMDLDPRARGLHFGEREDDTFHRLGLD
ncbi:hypothetical protein GGF32_008383 [Allomyces javanicus]|nr:hypothetical protein GGF32_008383 [Allomyces javanicus]